MSGPWEKYSAPAQSGPWAKYQPQVSPDAARRAADADAEALRMMNDPGASASAMLGAAQGVTFGFGDEIAAALASMAPGVTYDDALQTARAGLAGARDARPVTTYGAEIAGALVAPGAGLAARAATAPATLGGRMAAGAATGAAMGGLYGSGAADEGSRLQGAAAGALVGGAAGAAAPAIAQGVGRGYERVMRGRAVDRAVKNAPDADALRRAASSLYDEADQVTGLPRNEFREAAQGMVSRATRSGMDPDLTPGAAKVASRIADAADDAMPPTIGFQEADILRRKAAIPAGNVQNRTEASIGSQMVEGIDRFIDNVDPALSGKVKEARDMWARLRRIETVEAAIEKAKNTASGFENGLRIEFRKILSNPKLLRGFSEAEREAIKTVVQGTTAGNLMRQIGRVGIGLSGQSNALGATVGAGFGGVLGGPIGAIGVPAVGTAAKALAERTTRNAAQRAVGIVAARPEIAAMPAITAPNVLSSIAAAPVSAAAPAYNALFGLPR